jgi:rare lipoprotein A
VILIVTADWSVRDDIIKFSKAIIHRSQQMKRLNLILLITPFIMVSCISGRDHVTVISPAPSSKTTTLPKVEKTVPSNFYIVNGERYYPLPDSLGFIETGKASWYGEDFHGKPTSSGETYDMYKKTAAHKTLPLGTYVQVINLENNESIIVRINDRGPFVKGRIIDLSYGAAKEIGMAVPGLADVKVIALTKAIGEAQSEGGYKPLLDLKEFENGEFTVQVGAFKNKTNALNLAERLKIKFNYVNIMEYLDKDNQVFFRVHVSKSPTLAKAGEFEKRLEEMGFTEAFILRI